MVVVRGMVVVVWGKGELIMRIRIREAGREWGLAMSVSLGDEACGSFWGEKVGFFLDIMGG